MTPAVCQQWPSLCSLPAQWLLVRENAQRSVGVCHRKPLQINFSLSSARLHPSSARDGFKLLAIVPRCHFYFCAQFPRHCQLDKASTIIVCLREREQRVEGEDKKQFEESFSFQPANNRFSGTQLSPLLIFSTDDSWMLMLDPINSFVSRHGTRIGRMN